MAIRLPQRVDLPGAGPTVPLAAVRAALGASRQSLLNWRRGHAFPRSFNIGHGWFLDRVALAHWLRSRGVEVRP